MVKEIRKRKEVEGGKRRKEILENGMEMEMECRGGGKTEYAKEINQ